MTDHSGIDWEDAFANMAHIPQGARYPDLWAGRAEAFRAEVVRNGDMLDIAYGAHPRECYDLFRPATAPRGLVVFVHGGFWLGFDKSSWSDLAAGPIARGWAVAMPSYTLAPEARISAITLQIGTAIAHAARSVDGPIRLAGHSAGGHLVTRMVCDDSPLSGDLRGRIARVVSISGVHDLRPLRLNSMNKRLGLDAAEAEAESPALRQPLRGPHVTAWVGAAERPEFLRQSALLAEAWTHAGTPVDLVAEPGRHHFDVVDGLRERDHPLTRALTGGGDER